MKRVKRWSDKKLVKVCTEWQKELGLRDWAIWVYYVKGTELQSPGCGAEVSTNMHSKQADIRVVRPEDIPKGKTMDVEMTLVHELCHIHVEGFFDHQNISYAAKIAWEQAIEAFARSLVRIKRSKGLRG